MNSADSARFIAVSPLFRELDPSALHELSLETSPVHLGGGETLLREGEAGDALYVVVSGRLSVIVGATPIAEVGRGETVGEMALLTGAPRSATVLAVRDTVLLRLSKDSF